MLLLLLINPLVAQNWLELYELPGHIVREESSDPVTGQYTDYPYPAYSKALYLREKIHYVDHSECRRGHCKSVQPPGPLLPAFYSYDHDLDILNQYLYQGGQNFQEFRVLVAGGGTGDDVLQMAEQLVDKKGQVVYLDLSAASQDVARFRAELKGLESNVTWIQGSIESIPELGLGKFHFIDCEGVLHHLQDKQAGLDTLAGSLTEDGGISLMVYHSVGRTGIYQIQRLLQLVNEGLKARDSQLSQAWSLLHDMASQDVTSQEVLKRRINFELEKPGMEYFHKVVREGREGEGYWDVEAYDMLLHTQDSPFSVHELYSWVENAGMHIAAAHHPHTIHQLSPGQKEQGWGLDSDLARRLRGLPQMDGDSIAGLVLGSVHQHNYFLSKKADSAAKIEDKDMLVSYNNLRTFTFRRPPTSGVIKVLEQMNKNRTFDEMLKNSEGIDDQLEVTRREFKLFFEESRVWDLLLLHQKSVSLQDNYSNLREQFGQVMLEG